MMGTTNTSTDVRVSRLIEQRLSGVYRDPARIIRDVSSVVVAVVPTATAGATTTASASNYNNDSSTYQLQPIVTMYANEVTGDTIEVLTLQGTIAIYYKQNTYQLLFDIYIIPQYPIQPPISYVRLLPNMYIKPNHPHVTTNDGKVQNHTIPYLATWDHTTHTLQELLIHFSSIFSNDPPVFTRPSPLPSVPTAATAAAVVVPRTTTTTTATTMVVAPAPTSANSTYYNNNNNWSLPSSTQQQRQQLEWALQQQDQHQQQLATNDKDTSTTTNTTHTTTNTTALEIYQQEQIQQMKYTINAKLQTYIREQQSYIQQYYIIQDQLDHQQLQEKIKKIKKMKQPQPQQNHPPHPHPHPQQIDSYKHMEQQIQSNIQMVDQKIHSIQEWIQLQKEYSNSSSSSSSTDKSNTTKSIDELVIVISNKQDHNHSTTINYNNNNKKKSTSKIQEQIVQYEVEYNTIRDTLYFLDLALYNNTNNHNNSSNSSNNNPSTTTSATTTTTTTNNNHHHDNNNNNNNKMMTIDVHLKHVRSLAKQQFYIQAHLYKLLHHHHHDTI